jgi:holo-[acyl-carrier protein] synthase
MRNYIGTDIIEIGRIRRAVERRGERFLRRVYTEAELELCGGKAPSLAARFAGKEAVMKLLGAKGISWQDIEILAEPNGRPSVTLRGGAQRRAASQGIRDIDISLSHCREYAVAAAVGSA